MSVPRAFTRIIRSKVAVRIMWFLLIAAVAAAVLVGLEVDFLENFRDRPFGQDYLELEEILFLTTLIVGGLLIFGLIRQRAQKREIRRREAAERYALDLAFHDPLTGLPNRRKFMDELDAALGAPPHGDSMHAVILMDLNSFKAVNDTHGHPAGDELLIEIASAMKAKIGKDAVIARLGGDEFAVIARDLPDIEAVGSLGQRVIAAFEHPFPTKSGEHRVGVGLGVALMPRDALSRAELVRKADLALYRAKSEGTSSMSFFSADMDAQMRERAFVEGELRAALGTREVSPRYQPSVDLKSGRILAFDVLPQWNHPTLGAVPLQRFAPVAEDSGLVRQMTDQILRYACNDAAAWPDEIGLSMRLSDAAMRDPALALRVLSILAETRLAPSRLEISIGESALMRNLDESRRLLKPLREAGIRLALANFGTSYASIWHLRDLQFDKLKIDRSFIEDMATNDADAVIVRTILGMGQGLGITISADGIESSGQRDQLQADGLSEGQGAFFGSALDAEAANRLVREQAMDFRAKRA
jgi:diguanylate cyclase (GGDEF)-like protein